MRKPKLRELVEAIKAVAKGPYTVKFPFQPPQIDKAFRGLPKFNKEKCVLCGACERICPTDAITCIDDEVHKIRTMHRDWNKCIWCSQCAAYCTVKEGIDITNEFDISTLDKESAQERIEDELVLCEHCGVPISSKKHLLWVANRLGTKAFSNQTLTIVRMMELGLADEESPTEHKEILREDIFRMLCPKCRRAAMVAEDLMETG